MVSSNIYDMIRSSEEIELLQCTFQPKTNAHTSINSAIPIDDKCA